MLDDPQTALKSPARRKFSEPAVAWSKSNRWRRETYVLIKSSVVFLNPCTVMVSDSQSLFAVYLGMGTCGTSALTALMSPLSTVGELISLALWYIMHSGSFGGAVLWNGLPENAKMQTPVTFTKLLKNHLSKVAHRDCFFLVTLGKPCLLSR